MFFLSSLLSTLNLSIEILLESSLTLLNFLGTSRTSLSLDIRAFLNSFRALLIVLSITDRQMYEEDHYTRVQLILKK